MVTRPFSAEASLPAVEAEAAPAVGYSKALGFFHWGIAGAVIGCVGSVMIAQEAKKQPDNKMFGKGIGDWMFYHKSFGLLTGILVAPRVAIRLAQKSPPAMPGIVAAPVEHLLAKLTHVGLYGFMTFMPASGIYLGYYGGKGLPFFTTTFVDNGGNGRPVPAWGISVGQNFSLHKQVGYWGKFLIPAHAGAAVAHQGVGHQIFARIAPF